MKTVTEVRDQVLDQIQHALASRDHVGVEALSRAYATLAPPFGLGMPMGIESGAAIAERILTPKREVEVLVGSFLVRDYEDGVAVAPRLFKELIFSLGAKVDVTDAGIAYMTIHTNGGEIRCYASGSLEAS